MRTGRIGWRTRIDLDARRPVRRLCSPLRNRPLSSDRPRTPSELRTGDGFGAWTGTDVRVQRCGRRRPRRLDACRPCNHLAVGGDHVVWTRDAPSDPGAADLRAVDVRTGRLGTWRLSEDGSGPRWGPVIAQGHAFLIGTNERRGALLRARLPG